MGVRQHPTNSISPKQVTATCPADKRAISVGYRIGGGDSGAFPDAVSEVVVDQMGTSTNFGCLLLYENDPFAGSWQGNLEVLCAAVGP